jgi:predicted DNA-binding protein (UPF0251 family)
MSRPFKCRRVEFLPNVTYFKPVGIPLRDIEEVCLSVEEAEAIRLKDLEGLDQEQGAGKMNTSRPTFQRILVSARGKIAGAVLNGKAVRIEGGNFHMTWRRFRCHQGHEWELETPVSSLPAWCPQCHEPDVEPVLAVDTGFNHGEPGFGRGRHGLKGGTGNYGENYR